MQSPCGRHRLAVKEGTVLLDGRRVHSGWERVQLAGEPVWRADSRALAWIERADSGLRLVVVAQVNQPEQALYWALPAPAQGDHVAWAGPHRVVVGDDVLAPRAVATWAEE